MELGMEGYGVLKKKNTPDILSAFVEGLKFVKLHKYIMQVSIILYYSEEMHLAAMQCYCKSLLFDVCM